MEPIEAKGRVTHPLFVQQAMIWMRKSLLWKTFAIGICVFGIFGLAMGCSLSAVWTFMLLGMIAYMVFMTVIF